MSGSATTFLTARFLLPDYLKREESNAIQCPVYTGGSLVAPDSGTFTLLDESGLEVYTTAVSVVGSIAGATVPAVSLPLSAIAMAGECPGLWCSQE